MTTNTRLLTVFLLDAVILFMLYAAPQAIINYTVGPLIIIGTLVAFILAIIGKPVPTTWNKPTWFTYYDILTDILTLILCLVGGHIHLFFIYFFGMPFKYRLKHLPYESK